MANPTIQRTAMGAIALLAIIAAIFLLQRGGTDADRDALASGAVPMYDNLGDHHYPISSEVEGTQAYFDQGLRLYYAFNHAEAIRAFDEAMRIDPECAICAWGSALAYGPNINAPIDPEGSVAAHAALEEARRRLDSASDRERALIGALGTRYSPDPDADRAPLDSAYAAAMQELAVRYPDDQDIAVLAAEAMMDLRPWQYWTSEGQPQPGTTALLAGLERVIEANPRHPGACHFFIHAVEEVQPQRALPCAERLAALMPGAGHLVHMPGHIYIRVGRYADAIDANLHATHADENYIRDQRPGAGIYTLGYYPHNYDFLAFAASMAGQQSVAIDAAERIPTLLPEEVLGAPGFDFLQHHLTRPLQVHARFGNWDAILAAPVPPDSLIHARAMSSYARGRALLAGGDVAGAREQLANVREALQSPGTDGMRLEFNEARSIQRVAELVLAGHLEEAEGNLTEAVALLREAARTEDGLVYGEPPEWTVPVRQDLGRILLAAGQASAAEEAFTEDLARFPDNGWSLAGLVASLRAQGRVAEADSAAVAFEVAWADADALNPFARR